MTKDKLTEESADSVTDSYGGVADVETVDESAQGIDQFKQDLEAPLTDDGEPASGDAVVASHVEDVPSTQSEPEKSTEPQFSQPQPQLQPQPQPQPQVIYQQPPKSR